MEKTLVILIGDSRGGEKTWHTMYDHLLKPFNADLALCFGYKENKIESLKKGQNTFGKRQNIKSGVITMFKILEKMGFGKKFLTREKK